MSSRRLFIIPIMLGLMLMVSAVSNAQTDIDTVYGLVTVDTADVRIGPDFAYDSIGQLPRDASVTILGRAGDFFQRWDGRQWLKIDYGSSPAWIYARLLRTSVAFNSIAPVGRLLPRDFPVPVAMVETALHSTSALTAAELSRKVDINVDRARVLPAGIAITLAIADICCPLQIIGAPSGIRAGLLQLACAGEV